MNDVAAAISTLDEKYHSAAMSALNLDKSMQANIKSILAQIKNGSLLTQSTILQTMANAGLNDEIQHRILSESNLAIAGGTSNVVQNQAVQSILNRMLAEENLDETIKDRLRNLLTLIRTEQTYNTTTNLGAKGAIKTALAGMSKLNWVSLIASFLPLIISVYDQITTSAEEAAEAAKEAIDTYNSELETLKSNKSTIDEIGEEWDVCYNNTRDGSVCYWICRGGDESTARKTRKTVPSMLVFLTANRNLSQDLAMEKLKNHAVELTQRTVPCVRLRKFL